MAKRIVTSSPPVTGACVLSQLVPPASANVPKPSSKPVPMSSAMPLGQYGMGGAGQPEKQSEAKLPMPAGSQTSKNAILTLTGLVLLSNEIFPLIDPIGGGDTSAMN